MATALLALGSTLLINYLIFTMRQNARFQDRQELLLSGIKTMDRITLLLSETRASLLSQDSNTGGVLFPLARSGTQTAIQTDSTGNLVWQSWESLGFSSTTKVVSEGQQTIATPTSIVTTLLTLLPTNASTWKRRTLTDSATAFTVTVGVNNAVQVRLLLTSPNYKQELISTVVALN